MQTPPVGSGANCKKHLVTSQTCLGHLLNKQNAGSHPVRIPGPCWCFCSFFPDCGSKNPSGSSQLAGNDHVVLVPLFRHAGCIPERLSATWPRHVYNRRISLRRIPEHSSSYLHCHVYCHTSLFLHLLDTSSITLQKYT